MSEPSIIKNRYKQFLETFGLLRTKEILGINPTITPTRDTDIKPIITIYEYNETYFKLYQNASITDCKITSQSPYIKWINVDGINSKTIAQLSEIFNIHYLVTEDIESIGQRPKVDELDDHIFCLLQMLYFNKKTESVESEQLSIVLGKNYVITFQEDAQQDVFNSLRDKIKLSNTKLRQKTADYLCYTLLDLVVDNYFVVMDLLGDKIENLEEEIIRTPNTKSLAKINFTRKELIVLKRNIAPVREIINGFWKSENELIEENTTKYFKDIYDHIIQATDLVENYRDMMTNMHDLYINQVNLKLNEVMKVMAIVTCLLAPAAIISGIFGMNFDRIPYLHNHYGFFIAVGLMIISPLIMMYFFKKRGWY